MSVGWVLFAGCPTQTPAPPAVSALPYEGITLQVAVVDDPAIAAGISRLSSEWQAVTGSSLEITQFALADLSNKPLAGDVLIVPPVLLGKLAAADTLAEVPKGVLERPAYEWHRVFEVLKTHETDWGGKTIALPLGSPVFTLIYRKDLLARLDRRPPTTWEEYQQLIEALSRELHLPCLEPVAEGWAGKLLLARAACYAKHADHYSALFRADTMEPLIAGPPFERALTELVAAARLRADSASYDPTEVRREVLAGRAAMAITWASAAGGHQALQPREAGAEFGFVELPGSTEVYDYRRQKWDRRTPGESGLVPLVAATGRLACVSKRCQFTEPAIELALWLSGPKWGDSVAAQSPATTLFRDSHLRDSRLWCDSDLRPAEADAYGETVQRALQHANYLAALRIPAADEYMNSLDAAVISAIAGDQSPQAALELAAKQWEQITDRVGREAQRRAYQHSNGLAW